MMTFSTAQVAKKANVSRRTIDRWIREGFRAPALTDVFGIRVRRWSQQDVDRLLAFKKQIAGRRGPRLKGR